MSLDPFRPEAWDEDRAQQLRLMRQESERRAFEDGKKAGRLGVWQEMITNPSLN